jgi:hypothetical protein
MEMQIKKDFFMAAFLVWGIALGALLSVRTASPSTTMRNISAGVSGQIGGTKLSPGDCTSGAVSVPGAQPGASVALTSPAVYPGNEIVWRAYISANDVLTVSICNMGNRETTPKAGVYQIRVIQ